MSDESPESLGDEPTYVGKAKEHEDQSLGDQSTYAGSNESSLGDLGGIGDDLGDSLAGLEIVDLESRYTIIRPIGKGGMGEVFLATDTRLNRKVAIKRIKDELTTPAAAARFLTEAKSIAALSHPYIVQVYDYGRAKDGPFLIMEYVEGENLQQVCNQGVMSLEDAIDLACKLCDALAKAHSLGIIHRDIKPANILMTEEGWPKISDFGLAKSTSDHGHTMTGTALGTLDFMPPEQRRDASAVDHRSDLWSLAATIYQMVTGEPPKVIDLEEVPPVLRTVLGKALKTQPDKRYQNAKSFKDDIEQCNSSNALPIGQLNIGECPNCNTRNESNRKYCRECAASLVVDCLGCGESIAVWDKICGECGNNQEEALKAKLSEYTRLQEDAEGLRLSYRYEEAVELSKQGANDYASIFPDAAAWAEEFTADTQRDQAEQLEKTEKIYEAAKKARLNYDYRSACQMMEEIPKELLDANMKDFFQATKREGEDVKRLQKLVNDRLNSEKHDGLLPLVEQLLELQPERSSVKRLYKKVVKWDEEAKLSERLKDLSGKGMFTLALSQVENYLLRNPNSKEAVKLKGDLKEREQGEIGKLEENVRFLSGKGMFTAALRQVGLYLKRDPDSKEILELRDALKKKENEDLKQKVREHEKRVEELSGKRMFTAALSLVEGFLQAYPNSKKRMLELRDALEDKKKQDDLIMERLRDLQNKIDILILCRSPSKAFPLIESYLRLSPESSPELRTMQVIHDDLLEKLALRDEALIKTNEFNRECKFNDAVATLESVPNEFQDEFITKLHSEYSALLRLQKKAFQSLASADNNCKKRNRRSYLTALFESKRKGECFRDTSFDKAWSDFQLSRKKKKRQQLIWASPFALVSILLFLAIGFTQSAFNTSRVSSALDRGDYHTALRIDPGNTQALSMQTAAIVKRALARGNYLTVLELDPSNTQALSMKKITDLKIAIKRGDYQTALRLDPSNTQALSMKKNAEVEIARIKHIVKTELTLIDDGLTRGVTYSPDGKSIVSGGPYTLKIWDAKTGKKKLTLKGHTNVYSVAYSPDGNSIVSGSNDTTIKIWDAETGEEKRTLKGHTASVYSVAYSPDSNSIVSGSGDHTIKIWDAKTEKEKLTLKGHTEGVYSVAYSPDGNSIVSGSNDTTIKIWDAETGEEKRTLKGHLGEVRSVAFSPDGNSIVSGDFGMGIKIWNAKTGYYKTLQRTQPAYSSFKECVAFSPDGYRIVSGGDLGVVKIWNAKTGAEELTHKVKGQPSNVYSVAFSPDGTSIALGTHDAIKIWDVGPAPSP